MAIDRNDYVDEILARNRARMDKARSIRWPNQHTAGGFWHRLQMSLSRDHLQWTLIKATIVASAVIGLLFYGMEALNYLGFFGYTRG